LVVRALPTTLVTLDERRLLTGVYVVRLSLGIALAAAATFVRTTEPARGSHIPLVLAVVGIPLAFTLVSMLYARRRPIGRTFLYAQVLHDMLLVSLAVILTGGVQSEFALFYLLLIAAAGLLLGLGGGAVTAVITAGVYLTISYWQLAPSLARRSAVVDLPNISGTLPSIMWSLGLTATVFLVVGVASGLAAQRFRIQRARLAELEEQLAEARIDAQDILNTVESGILSINAQEEIDFVNYTARAQLGISGVPRAGELRASDSRGVAELYVLLIETLRSEREVEYAELALSDPAGKSRPFSVSTTVLYDPRGRKRGAAAILKDIEHVKRLEELARQADRLKAVAELAAGLAHEIRNPLAAIRSSIELLNTDDRSAEDGRLMDLVIRETDRLSSLIGDFMAFSRTSLKSRGRVDLAEIVDDAIEVERLAAGGETRARLVFTRPPKSYWVEGDPNLLKQVCLNLLANAREAVSGKSEGRVEVRVGANPQLPGIERASGPFVTLEVRDNGRGIDAAVREKIFDPFFTTRPNGFGMGLAIVHRIVDLHGGMVWVDSELNKGSTFRIALPRAQ
jgi:two-component system sensor histidine kinase PilS (NtrC family)